MQFNSNSDKQIDFKFHFVAPPPTPASVEMSEKDLEVRSSHRCQKRNKSKVLSVTVLPQQPNLMI